MDNKMETV